MALLRTAGLCRLALRTQWASLRLLSSAAGGEPPAEDKPGRRVNLEALRRERALRPPSDRAPPALPRKVFSTPKPTLEQLQLNQDIQACASGEAVLALVSSSLAMMNEVNISTALITIARRVGKSEAASLSGDPRFAQLLSAAESLFERMAPRNLSNAVYACGQLGITPQHDWLERFWQASAAKLDDFDPQNFSNTVYACGQLGIVPPAGWMQRYWQVSASKLAEFDPQAYSNTMYTCGQLGMAPPPDWLERYWEASGLKLGEFKPQNLSNTLYACGQLDISPPDDWLERYWHASALKLGDFIPQHFSNTLYACGQLCITPPDHWLGRLWHASALRFGDFTTQELSNTLYACGQLDITPLAYWLERFWHASAATFGDFDPQAYSNTLYACAQLGITPPGDWLERFWHASASKLGDFNSQDFSNTIYACGQLGIVPPADWMQRFWQASTSTLAEFDPQALSNTLYACGLLDTRPPADWMQHFSSACEQALPDLNRQTLANIALAMAMLQLWELPLWPSLWERLCSSLPRDTAGWNADDQLGAMQMYQAYQAAAVERPGLLPAPERKLLPAVRKSWIDGLDTDMEHNSRLHAAVSACLRRLGVTHANERWCERAERRIDIAIELDGSAPVALEVDGPSHFLQDGRPDGPTLLRNRMLTAHGWRVVSVDYRTWNAQQTEPQQEAYLRRLLADA